MSARRAFAGLTLAALVTMGACHRQRPVATTPARADQARPEAVMIHVDNHYRADVVIYIQRGSLRTRLGTIVTAASANYRLPNTYVGDSGGFYLIADGIGGAATRSDRIIVHGGEQIAWSLESDLARSSLSIY